MAKACVYLCHQCFYIDGFGEFGEFIHSIYRQVSRAGYCSSLTLGDIYDVCCVDVA